MLPPAIEDVLCAVVARIPPDTQWAVSCGSALALHGLAHEPDDLDLFADQRHAARIVEALGDLAVKLPYAERVAPHITSHWGRFVFDGVEIDIVGDFTAKSDGRATVWDAGHPCWGRLELIAVRELRIPVFGLDDLIALYEALDEDDKVRLVKTSRGHGIRTGA